MVYSLVMLLVVALVVTASVRREVFQKLLMCRIASISGWTFYGFFALFNVPHFVGESLQQTTVAQLLGLREYSGSNNQQWLLQKAIF